MHAAPEGTWAKAIGGIDDMPAGVYELDKCIRCLSSVNEALETDPSSRHDGERTLSTEVLFCDQPTASPEASARDLCGPEKRLAVEGVRSHLCNSVHQRKAMLLPSWLTLP